MKIRESEDNKKGIKIIGFIHVNALLLNKGDTTS